jgi:hypothetical protein
MPGDAHADDVALLVYRQPDEPRPGDAASSATGSGA